MCAHCLGKEEVDIYKTTKSNWLATKVMLLYTVAILFWDMCNNRNFDCKNISGKFKAICWEQISLGSVPINCG